MHVIVLGSGLLGISSAWYLSQLGHEVTVIDRQASPAAETSHANGGQISVSHAEPWANPAAPLKVLKWLGQEDAPLLFRLRADMHQWLWGLQFLRECTPERTRHNIRQIVQLGTYSRAMLQQLRHDTGLQYDHRTQGILHFYTSQKEFDSALEPARQMRDLGCDRLVISAAEALALEPALATIGPKLVGATYTAEDESGDAYKFTVELAKLCEQRGVRFLMSHHITQLAHDANGVSHVEVTNPQGDYLRLSADSYVLAMGSFSPAMVAPLGLKLPIYPAKGYSVTLPVADPTLAYELSLTDDEFKLVFSRYTTESGRNGSSAPPEDRLRIAGTAELGGYDRHLNEARCQAIVRRVQQLFPGAADLKGAQFWAGLRPATPSNVPLIGQSRVRNLFLNTGHGTLGWTHACGSGKALADIVSGRVPDLDFAFQGAAASAPKGTR